MNRAHRSMPTLPRRPLLLVLAIVIATVAAGCVYRPTIQQGNLLKVEDVDQVTTGMTRSQVRYILGTPMISDPFDPQRWDYVYTLKRGRDEKMDRAHFIVYFEGDKVSRVEREALEYVSDKGAGKSGNKANPGHEPPPPPPVEQRQPDAPRPGSRP
jgi:outer membrane protein assembly factor BamE